MRHSSLSIEMNKYICSTGQNLTSLNPVAADSMAAYVARASIH